MGDVLQGTQLLRSATHLHPHCARWGFLPNAPLCPVAQSLLCFDFLVHHSLVEFYLQEPRKKDTSIEVTFLGSNVTSSVKITIPRHQFQGKGIIAYPYPSCQINQVKFKFQASSRMWKKDRTTTIVGSFCTSLLPVHDSKKTVCLPEPVTLQASVAVSHALKIACV